MIPAAVTGAQFAAALAFATGHALYVDATGVVLSAVAGAPHPDTELIVRFQTSEEAVIGCLVFALRVVHRKSDHARTGAMQIRWPSDAFMYGRS
jgi:hypothetical protein